jgi:hypothetical protein
MKNKLMLLMLTLLTGLGFTMNASAQDWNCSDLTWSAERLESTPDIATHCLDVIERNGIPYAKLHARVIQQSVNSTVVEYQSANGTWSGKQRVFPGDFTAEIGGKTIKIEDLPVRQEVNVYVKPEDNFTYASAAPAPAPAAAPAPAPAPAAAPAPAPEPAPVALPTTATQFSLFALLGGLLVLMGGIIAVVRTRL